MAIFLRISVALLLGVYSSFGLHHYSLWVSRTRNDAARLLLFVAAFALFIAGPLAECAGLSHHLFKRSLQNPPAIMTLSWLAVVLLYLVLNWRTFDERFRAPMTSDGGNIAAGK